MQKPRIAIIGTKGYPFVYSGYDTFLSQLAKRLSDRYELHVYAHRSLFERRPPWVNGVKVHYLPAIETARLTHLSHGLLSTLHAIWKRYDLYLFVNSCHGPFAYLFRNRARLIINTDGLEWCRPQFRGAVARYYRWSSRLCARAFGTLVSDSHVMAEVYEREFGRRSEVIAYGAELDDEAEVAGENPLGLERGSYYLVVGRLIPDNNAELIIDGLLRSSTSRKLVIVGDFLFPDRFSTRVKRRASERVIFTGFVRDQGKLRALYRDAFAYLHGHQSGGTNPSLLTALASGCCVLALDTPFAREQLDGDRHGVYFTQSPDSVARAIARVEGDLDLRERLRSAGPDRIRRRYRWDAICDQYDALFQRVLDEARSPARLQLTMTKSRLSLLSRCP